MQRLLVHLCVAVFAIAGLFASAPRASAEFINLEYKGNAGGSVDVTLNNTHYQAHLLGPFTWKDTNLSPNPAFNNPIKSFCIELDQMVVPPTSPPTATFRVTNPADAPTLNAAKFEAIKALYGNNYDFATDSVKGGKNAAFQLALWEIIYDLGDVDFNGGHFSANAPADIENDAAAMLNNVSEGIAKYNASGYELVALVAPAGLDENGNPAKSQDPVQDQLTIRPKPISTPAPAGLILGGIAVVTLVGRARLNRRPPTAT